MMTDEEIIKQWKAEPASELRRLQGMPYEWKVEHAKDVIREFVEHEGEDHVYVSFSGGKDSLVLLHLVRSIYPNVKAVFANTGIEFPEQVKFVRTFPDEKPEWGKEVLVLADDGDIRKVRFSCDYKWISWGNMRTCESSCITHWMPEPKAPEEAK